MTTYALPETQHAFDDWNDFTGAELTSLEAQASQALRTFAAHKKGWDEPRINAVIARFGWSGEEPITLDEAGSRIDVTRERLRQICNQVLAELAGIVDVADIAKKLELISLDLRELTITESVGEFLYRRGHSQTTQWSWEGLENLANATLGNASIFDEHLARQAQQVDELKALEGKVRKARNKLGYFSLSKLREDLGLAGADNEALISLIERVYPAYGVSGDIVVAGMQKSTTLEGALYMQLRLAPAKRLPIEDAFEGIVRAGKARSNPAPASVRDTMLAVANRNPDFELQGKYIQLVGETLSDDEDSDGEDIKEQLIEYVLAGHHRCRHRNEIIMWAMEKGLSVGTIATYIQFHPALRSAPAMGVFNVVGFEVTEEDAREVSRMVEKQLPENYITESITPNGARLDLVVDPRWCGSTVILITPEFAKALVPDTPVICCGEQQGKVVIYDKPLVLGGTSTLVAHLLSRHKVKLGDKVSISFGSAAAQVTANV